MKYNKSVEYMENYEENDPVLKAHLSTAGINATYIPEKWKKVFLGKQPKQYRFFYHYYKQKKKMSVHYKGVCYVVDNVQCDVPCVKQSGIKHNQI